MDEQNKKFFEELAGASSSEHIIDQAPPNDIADSSDDEPEEPKAMLVKMGSSTSTRSRKIATTVSGNEAELPVSQPNVNGEFEENEGQLTVDIYQTLDEIVIQSTVAGVRPEDLDIQITPESVTIRGMRQREEEVRDQDYFYQECYWGRFSRSVILPQEIDAEKAAASLKNGVLIIRLPKLNRQKTKKLKVKFT
ncbi:hypothetical protein A3A20_01735 [Candidatus Wolfebacteria bacterium RIFCSPLOWO2_01_FULL_45_19]|uniref:Uncharacterized protein n=1 Tax=Candidatus Wolfebacteria bacterium RIFCSPLOWO2_01_FULL_45_19 TaxID=1802557 RepID=A0A1F8DSP6_9BACT|nr:MAG: Protein containing Heat shock protein Hsp20 protein [Parcubacteria group bacterium GW2011_GWB1_45_9]OGM91641.1 MAG: hypothetical protein A3A20_01735 [Candidatus Wolfebacteria bacterium RIFCSPLOWO2_01_FULL_45_19]